MQRRIQYIERKNIGHREGLFDICRFFPQGSDYMLHYFLIDCGANRMFHLITLVNQRLKLSLIKYTALFLSER